MPQINLTHVVRSPRFAEKFTVQRRAQVMTAHGRVTTTIETFEAWGTVTIGSANDLIRADDQQHQRKTITVHTDFRLRGPSPSFQPDIVVWTGDHFVVRDVRPWTQYGSGFVCAECMSIDAVDQPPP